MSKQKPIEIDASMPSPEGYDWMPYDQLLFDAENPRLLEYLDTKRPSQDDLLKVLWEQMSVDELAMSIAASGFFDHEPLLVIKKDDQHIVIEGNRRLAAVKLLKSGQLREKLKATDLPKLTAAQSKDLDELPIILTTRKDSWKYIGFKHVNGPAKWDSYAKAQYIGTVHDEEKVSLDEIARQIGDKHRTVQRLYRALKVIAQAEKTGTFKREHRYKDHFSFSHLYTGLDYDGIATFIDISDEANEEPNPVPFSKLGHLKDLLIWLYGDRRNETRPLVESQNPDLRNLDMAIQSPRGVETLRAGLPLQVAVERSMGDDQVFRKALIESRESLQKARATLSTGFIGQADLLRVAGEVADLADDLVAEMQRKIPGKRQRRSRDDE